MFFTSATVLYAKKQSLYTATRRYSMVLENKSMLVLVPKADHKTFSQEVYGGALINTSFLLCFFHFVRLCRSHFLFSTWRHVECACFLCHGLMFRLVVSWPVSPLYVPLSVALILGFVCSIWAKFSNGDNNRGRPREWRRWVLPFDCVNCMHSPSQSTTSPSILSFFSPLSTDMHHLGFSIDSVLPSSAIVTVSLTNYHLSHATVNSFNCYLKMGWPGLCHPL